MGDPLVNSLHKLIYLPVWFPLAGIIFLILPSSVVKYSSLIFQFASLVASLFFIQFFFTQPDFSVTWILPWIDINGFSANFSFQIDNISCLIAFIVCLISFLVGIYSSSYISLKSEQKKFWLFLLLFQFSMLGLLFSTAFISFFLFWELVGFSSFLLIGFYNGKKESGSAAMKAFLFNKISDLFLLAGFIFLIVKGDINSFDKLSTSGFINSSELTSIVPYLLIVGGLAKSAQFPLQGWLPHAMAGPTPASALIHAATMVTAGVYLQIRLLPVYSDIHLIILGMAGALSAIWGGFCAIGQVEIKKLLAFSTISQLGLMMVAVSTENETTAILHLLTHAFFKCGLFLIAGIALHYFITKSLNENEQSYSKFVLPKNYRTTFLILILILLLSLTGIPFTSGYISKESILLSLLEKAHTSHSVWTITFLLTLLSVFLTGIYSGRFLSLIYSNKNGKITSDFKMSFQLLVPVIICSVLSLSVFWTGFHILGELDSVWFISLLNISAGPESGIFTIVLPFVSTLLAVGGFLIGYNFTKKFRFIASEHLTSLSINQFYIDILYSGIYSIFSELSAFLNIQDKRIYTGIIYLEKIYDTVIYKGNNIGISGIARKMEDTAGNIIPSFFSGIALIGNAFIRILQNGKIQTYLYFSLIFFLLLFILINSQWVC